MFIPAKRTKTNLTVRFLVPRSGARTAKLLGLAAPGVHHQEGAVVGDEDVTDLLLGLLINVLLVVGDESLADGLPDSVHLGHMTTAPDAHTDVDASEAFSSQKQQRLLQLGAEDDGLHLIDGPAVHLHQTIALLAVSDGGGRFLSPEH